MLMSIDIYAKVIKIDEINYDFDNAVVVDRFIPNEPFVFAKYMDNNHVLKTIYRHEWNESGEEDILDISRLRSFAISTVDNVDIIRFLSTIQNDLIYVFDV